MGLAGLFMTDIAQIDDLSDPDIAELYTELAAEHGLPEECGAAEKRQAVVLWAGREMTANSVDDVSPGTPRRCNRATSIAGLSVPELLGIGNLSDEDILD